MRGWKKFYKYTKGYSDLINAIKNNNMKSYLDMNKNKKVYSKYINKTNTPVNSMKGVGKYNKYNLESISHLEREGEDIVGVIISVNKDVFGSLQKDYYFSFCANKDVPFPKDIIKKNKVNIGDLIDSSAVDKTLMGHDLDIIKLKMRILLKDIGWNICEFGTR